MPLRDHFRSPVNDRHSWDELHGGWPMMIVRHLFDILPPGYVAAPGVHLGRAFELDVSAFEEDEPSRTGSVAVATEVDVATSAPPRPTLTLETDLFDLDEYEVRVYDDEHGRRLVAAIEIVSPANTDRPESRKAFVAKVAALLQKDVCVSVVDLVTVRRGNVHADLLELIGANDPMLGPPPSHLYAVTVRVRERPEDRSLLETWYDPMTLGHPLPTLPIWLDVDRNVLLPLEESYEETCRLLHIR